MGFLQEWPPDKLAFLERSSMSLARRCRRKRQHESVFKKNRTHRTGRTMSACVFFLSYETFNVYTSNVGAACAGPWPLSAISIAVSRT
jgi:hypothetical protein